MATLYVPAGLGHKADPDQSANIKGYMNTGMDMVDTCAVDVRPCGNVGEQLCNFVIDKQFENARILLRGNERELETTDWIFLLAFKVRNAPAGTANQYAKWIIGDPRFKCESYSESEDWWKTLTERHVPPVFVALHSGRNDVAKFMVEHGCKDVLNEQGSKSKRTALHWAVTLGPTEIVSELFNGFDTPLNTTLKDAQGMTPLDLSKGPVRKLLLRLAGRDDMRQALDALSTYGAILVQATFPQDTGWMFNYLRGLSFVFAMAFLSANYLRAEPRNKRSVLVAGSMLAVSVVFALLAFGVSQFQALQEREGIFRVPVVVGIALCSLMLFWLVKRLSTAPAGE